MYLTAHPYEHLEWQTKRLGEEKVQEVQLKSRMYCKKQREEEKMYWKQKLLEDYNIKG